MLGLGKVSSVFSVPFLAHTVYYAPAAVSKRKEKSFCQECLRVLQHVSCNEELSRKTDFSPPTTAVCPSPVKLGSHSLFSWSLSSPHSSITAIIKVPFLCNDPGFAEYSLKYCTSEPWLLLFLLYATFQFSLWNPENLIIHFIVLFFQHVKWVLQWFESILKLNCICFEQVQMNTQALVNQAGAIKIIGKVIPLRNCLILSTFATAMVQ